MSIVNSSVHRAIEARREQIRKVARQAKERCCTRWPGRSKQCHGQPCLASLFCGGQVVRQRLAVLLAECFPSENRYKRYFEPFFRGGAVYVPVRPRRAVISDFNAGLIECYRRVRRNPQAVASFVRACARRRIWPTQGGSVAGVRMEKGVQTPKFAGRII